MSTIKLKFRPSIQKEKKGSLYFQVIHQRTIRQVSLGCKLFQNEWDADEGTDYHKRAHQTRQGQIDSAAFS